MLLSSSLIITIISLSDDACWFTFGCTWFTCLHPRCTGCTTSVPAVFVPCGTPETPTPVGIFAFAECLYQVYHRFCVSFSSGPWTVVIESWLDSLINRYKWYTCPGRALTQGFPVYQYAFRCWYTFNESSINIRLCGVPGCTTNSRKNQRFFKLCRVVNKQLINNSI